MKIRIKNPIWGIPITGLKYLWSDGTIHTEYNGATTQFEITDMSTMSGVSANYWTMINGVPKYSRVFIKKKDDLTPTTTQFEIIDARTIALNDKQKNKNTYLIKDADGAINGKPTYARICIKKKDDLTPTPTQFEIVGWSRHNDLDMDGGYWIGGCNDATINGKIVYRRILIRKIRK